MSVHKYSGDSVEVTYDPVRCIHAAACVKGLPSVFDPKKTPWVNTEGASAEAIASAVAKCPTGALRAYVDGADAVATPQGNTVTAAENGPVYVEGDLSIALSDGSTQKEIRVALCRCGASTNKPFCDGKHTKAGFTATGSAKVSGDSQVSSDSQGELVISLAPNGPALLNGSFKLGSAPGETQTKGAVCRCGASEHKPMCDGAHKAISFEG
jgi:CDGSH-type Zn-finger protein/uncharacterized Fe-S cluster protein YjdI